MDSDLLNVLHDFKPTSPISSFDACGNYLVTCSPYSQLLMIYDLREMKLVSATQLYLPIQIKFLSRFTTKCCIVSRNGQFAIVDLTCPNNIKYGSLTKFVFYFSIVVFCFIIFSDKLTISLFIHMVQK